jgi:hypothetical protein
MAGERTARGAGDPAGWHELTMWRRLVPPYRHAVEPRAAGTMNTTAGEIGRRGAGGPRRARQRGLVPRVGRLLLALTVVAVLFVWAPPAAHAAVTSANPADGTGELYPDFTTDDALFAYVTSDTRGGRVCVIAATGDGSCDAPAWGSPNTIVGIGTLFILLEGPDLEVGTWRLRTENPTPDGWERGYTSAVFGVRPCEVDCDKQIGRQQADDFKRASGATRDATAKTCTGFAVVTEIGRPVKVRLPAVPPGGRTGPFSGPSVGLSLSPTGIFLELFTSATGMDIARKMSCEVARMYDDIANDPPDPTLYEVAVPSFTALVPSDSPLLDEVTAALDRQAAHGIAARISYERYQGAVAAGDLAAQRLQAGATAAQARALVDELRDSVGVLQAAEAAVATDPGLAPLVVTAEQRAFVVDLATRVRAEGFTADERQQMADLGLTATQIDAVESWLDLPYEDVVVGQTVAGFLGDLADAFAVAVEPVDAFARNAAAVASTDLAPPTASLEAQYLSPGQWRFTATGGSSDGDPVVHEWDFGDGRTATGSVVEHTFTASGLYTVRVTTREDTPWGTSATATQPVSIVLNNPPTANEDRLGVAAGASATIDVLANDNDPEGDPIEVVSVTEATGGTATCDPGGECTYTAHPGLVGTETLQYVVSDGTATATGTLVVEIVPSSSLVAGDVDVTIPRGATAVVPLPVSDPDPGPLPVMEVEVVDTPSVVTATPSYPESLQITVPNDADAGTDTVTYRVYDGAQRSAPATVTVTIISDNRPPTAQDIDVTTPAGVPVPVVLLGDDPDGTPLQYRVTTNPDTGRLTGTSPDLVFDPEATAPGTVVSFMYEVHDGLVASAPATVTVTVGPPPGGPIVDLGDDLTLDEGTIWFNATARDPDGGPLTHLWDFGDGRTSQDASPSLVFDDGTYLVSLTVTDSLGRTSSDSLTLTVRNRPPNLFGIGVSGQARVVGLPVSLQAQVVDPAGDPLTYRFELGDGTVLDTTDAMVDHVYATPGDKLVRVTVTDDDGATATRTVTFDVGELFADAGPDLVVPEGSFVEFTGSGFLPFGLANYLWDFGDNPTPRQGVTAVHRWPGDEPRTATLTVTQGSPYTATDTVTVTFTNLPPTLGPAVPLVAEAGTPIDLLAGAFDPGDDAVTVTWDLGDGTVGSGERLRRAYASPGDYTIRITAVDDEGASAEAVASITVVEPGTLGPATVDSRGRSFHLAFDRNVDKAQSEQFLMVTGEQDTTGTVSVPGLGFRAEFAIAAGRVSTVRLPDDVVPSSEGFLSFPFPPPTVSRHAVIVHAREEVTVYGVNRQAYTTDAFLALPDDIAGTDHRIVTYGYQGAQVDVVAIHPDTEVTVTDGNASVTETIQPGEVLRVNDREPYFVDFAGDRVTANRPVQVLSGHFCTEVVTSFCDHLVEAVWSEPLMGRRFLTVPLATRAQDVFRVVATRDATEVRVDGVLVATLAAGEYHELQLSAPADITTSEPSLVAQFSTGGSLDNTASDPFMMLVPPEEQWLDRYTVATLAGIGRNYLNLVVRDGGQAGVRVDGAVVDPALWMPIGSSGFVGAQVPVGPGEHRITAGRPVSVAAYGFDVFDSYGYPGGMALAPVAAVAAIELSPAAGERQVGTVDCPVATVTDADGGPLAGVRLDLTVSGVNPAELFAVSGPDGTTELCFMGSSPGADDLFVRTGVTEARATRTWVEAPPPNEAPVASDVSVSTEAGVPVEVVLAGSDPDGDPVSFAVVAGPSSGTLGAVVGDRVTYTPSAGFAGTDTFTFSASDGTLSSAPATVTVTVLEPQDVDPPETTITAGPADPTTSTSASFTFVSDEAGSTFTCVLDGGVPEPCDAGSKTYGPLAPGVHTFSVAATDAAGNTDPTPATATWRIEQAPPPNEAPVASDVSVSTEAGVPVEVVLAGSDPDGDPVSFAVVAGPSSGTLGAVVGDRVTYTPSAGFAGTDTFTFSASDGTLSSAPATVTVTVLEPQDVDPPETTITAGPADPTTSTSASFTFVSDEAGSTFTCILDGGVPEPCDAGSKTYGPLAPGVHTFSVAATDAAGNTDPTPATATWRITGTTSLVYTGSQVVAVGATLTPKALLTATDGTCPAGQVVQFRLDDDPTTAVPGDGPFDLGAALTDAGGTAQAAGVPTAGWIEGTYTVSAVAPGSDSCAGALDDAILTVATPGTAASGGGFYTLAGSGRVSFGFTVRAVPKSSPVEHRGQLLLINTGKWRLKGTLDSYVRTGRTTGVASGSGRLYRWDATASGGSGDWVLAGDPVTFTVSFVDGGSGRKAVDWFGIQINHMAADPAAARLPNSPPQPLKGGNLVVS